MKIIDNLNILAIEYFYFKLVIEHRGINGAARQLGQDPGNISRMITKLESSIGANLFVRHKTGMSPTESANRLYRALTKAQKEFYGSLHDIGRHMTIRIGFESTIGHTHFSAVMTKKLIALNLAPDFTNRSSTELVEKMKSRELDFALINNYVTFPGLISKKIGTENLVLCSLTGELQEVLLIHPDMLHLEKVIHLLSYKRRWMFKDYFLIAKIVTHDRRQMGIVPESLLKIYPQLKPIRVYENVGKITGISWPGSIGVELLRCIES